MRMLGVTFCDVGLIYEGGVRNTYQNVRKVLNLTYYKIFGEGIKSEI